MKNGLKVFASGLALVLGVFSMNVLHAAEEMSDGPDMRPIVSIDKKNIENKTDQPRANFSALIDRLNHELTQTQIYRVVDIAALEDVLKKKEMFGAVADREGAGGTDISAPALLIGMTVTTYGFSSEVSHNAYTVSIDKSQVAKVELILKVIDARTAETKASVNLSETAVMARSVRGRGRDNDAEQVLQKACQGVCKKIVKELVKFTPFYVLAVEDGSVMTDIPPTVCKVGDHYDVFRQGKPIRNRRTGKVLRSEKKIAIIQIISVSEDSSMAKVVALYDANAVVDDKCILKPAASMPVLAPSPVPVPASPPSVANPF